MSKKKKKPNKQDEAAQEAAMTERLKALASAALGGSAAADEEAPAAIEAAASDESTEETTEEVVAEPAGGEEVTGEEIVAEEAGGEEVALSDDADEDTVTELQSEITPEAIEAAEAAESPAEDDNTPQFNSIEVANESIGDESSASEGEPHKVTDIEQIQQVLEAVIFAAPKAMSLVRLRNILNKFHYDTSSLTDVLESMMQATNDRGFQLVKVAGGYQYRTHPEHAEVLQSLLEDKPARLSASALEVLAIIAYKQPIARADIDSVRGVDSGHLLKGLLEKNLVRTLGHAETPGRPLLYGTAPYFLEVFSLNSLDDLPQIDELKRELVAGSDDPNVTGEDGLVLSAEPGFMVDSSGLGANPDRGAYDQPSEETVEQPDFGVEERAAAEVNP